ncbi:chitin synthase-domain-containing protein [Cunninghamella echinulata]|nr:chitin synthase-domain-containing protein [Cunninghamella echinulata]
MNKNENDKNDNNVNSNNNNTSWSSWLIKLISQSTGSNNINNNSNNNNNNAIATLHENDDHNESKATLVSISPHPPPSLRRQITRRIQLTRRGHLVLDCKVPDKLLNALPENGAEFKTMRYSAICCTPDQFTTKGYTLRQQLYKRETELLIVITMYNEDHILFARTLHGVMKNIAHLCSLSTPTWDKNGWKKIVVSIVADGRKIIHPRILSILASMGIYQVGVAKNKVDNEQVTAHIYEYTTQISIDADMNIKGPDKGIVPVQILLCIKEKNAKKIDSHKWCFNAFGSLLKPNVCVLLDVGTRPGNTSIYELWKVFDRHPNVGAACGELRVLLGTLNHQILHPLIGAQHFEYKMAAMLDKPMESVFGMISVLPGAFSAYRFDALQNDINQRGPLASYFSPQGHSLFERNMYLAEDRILCFELVAKRHQRWFLHYATSAFAETDVPHHLDEFISQRRRWINGSFFATIYSLYHFYWIPAYSKHSWSRIILLCIQALYNVFNLLFSWLAPGNFYIAFYFITKGLAHPDVDPFGNGWGLKLFDFFQFFYLFLIAVLFLSSMGNRPQSAKALYHFCVFGFSLIMIYALFGTSWQIYNSFKESNISNGLNKQQWEIVLSLIMTYGLYLVASILYFDPWPMLTSFFYYLLLLPCYVNILSIYAFCNTHDVSWGTKGDNGMNNDLGIVKTTDNNQTAELELPADEIDLNLDYEAALVDLISTQEIKPKNKPRSLEDYYRSFRTYLLLLWVVCNAILVVCVTSVDYTSLFNPSAGTTYMTTLLWINTALALFRFIGSCLYLTIRLFSS